MKIEAHKTFEKDTLKLQPFQQKVLFELIQNLELASNLKDVPNCKKLIGFKDAYRIRMGSFRVGLILKERTVFLVRVLSRKDIYKYFP